ncbi:MAG: hypothetical protein JJ863_14875 [Deltaproteobacteria bacterium]|nr:hypothetical protein [Deltaproteobacteria bacterium]
MSATIRKLLLLVALSASLSVGTTMVVQAQDNAREETAAPVAGDDEEDEDVNAEGEVRTEGGAKVKVYRFGGLDISGRLKSPQLLYFLNRLRAEFDRPKLPHRSFIPELERSTKGREL